MKKYVSLLLSLFLILSLAVPAMAGNSISPTPPAPLKLSANTVYLYDFNGNGKKVTDNCSVTFDANTGCTAYCMISDSISKVTSNKSSVCSVSLYKTGSIVDGRTQKVLVLNSFGKGKATVSLKDKKGKTVFKINVSVKKASKSSVSSVNMTLKNDTLKNSMAVPGAKKIVSCDPTVATGSVSKGSVSINGYTPGTTVLYVKNAKGKIISDIIVSVDPFEASSLMGNIVPSSVRLLAGLYFNSGNEVYRMWGSYQDGRRIGAVITRGNIKKIKNKTKCYTEIGYSVNGKMKHYYTNTTMTQSLMAD